MVQLVRKKFPTFQWGKYSFYNQGCDHDVIIFDNKTVFRVPKSKEYKEKIADEKRLLDYLGKHVKASVPQFAYVSKKEHLVQYDIVPGKELTVSRYRRMTAQEKKSFARQVAFFLTILHETPFSIAKRCKIAVDVQTKIFEKVQNESAQYIFPYVRKKDAHTMDVYMNDAIDLINTSSFVPVLTHGDMTEDHILWDAQRKKIGIIDFSDYAWTDPALDFTGLWKYGKKFVEQVYDFYKGEKDPLFFARSHVYYKRIPLYLMKDAQKRNNAATASDFQDGYTMYEKRFRIT